MRSKLSFLILLIAFCAVVGQEVIEGAQDANQAETLVSNPENVDANGEEIPPSYDYICGEGAVITLGCVRNFYYSTGLCTNSSHEDGVPIHRERQVTYLPNNKLTAITTNSDITFYGSKIIAFYINRRSNNMVMAVDFEGIYIDSKFTYFLFDRKAQEPLISGDYLIANYTTTLTAVTPNTRALTILATRVTAYTASAYPQFEIGPKISNSKNAVIADSYNSMLADVPTAVREIFLTEAHNFYFLYLQQYICDFGLPTSVSP